MSCALSYTQVTGEGAAELHSPSAEQSWNICSGHLLKPHTPGGPTNQTTKSCLLLYDNFYSGLPGKRDIGVFYARQR